MFISLAFFCLYPTTESLEQASQLGFDHFGSLKYHEYMDIKLKQSNQLPDGLIAQLVEHYTGIMLTAVHGAVVNYECAAPDQKYLRCLHLE